jgi:glucose/mannose-6-phosphate isomerase
MQPYFLIFTSQFTHPRNLRRIEIMKELFEKAGYPVTIITPVCTTLEQEALRIYQYMDYVTYYLAEAQGIDPEPVQMVEDFKQALG